MRSARCARSGRRYAPGFRQPLIQSRLRTEVIVTRSEGFDEWRDAGIGLRLVRTLVESAGGSLAIKSDPLGLTFSIELPPARLH